MAPTTGRLAAVLAVVAAAGVTVAFAPDEQRASRAANVDRPAPAANPKSPRRKITRPNAAPPVIRGRVVIGVVQPDAAAPPGLPNDLLIRAERETVRRLSLAREMIAHKQYTQACQLLQRVLDRDKDAFYYPDPEKHDVLLSVRVAARQMIGGMPREGRDAYELRYGGRARAMLEDAAKAGGDAKLQEVSRRYFHTKAGYEAAYRLGIAYLDRGQPLAAALCFDRLRHVPQAARQWDPLLTLRAAVAWNRAGVADKTEKTLAEFKRLNGSRTVRIGGKSVRPFGKPADAASWIATYFGSSPAAVGADGQWPLFRGNASRSAVAVLPERPGKIKWRMTTVTDPHEPFADELQQADTKRIGMLKETIRALQAANRQRKTPALPQAHPLVVGDLVLVRTQGCIRAIELKTGSRVWNSVGDLALYEMFLGTLDAPVPSALQRKVSLLLNQRLWSDLTWGSLSSDGRFLYAVEETELAFPTYDPRSRVRETPASANRLMAFNLRNAEMQWSLGGTPGNDPRLPDDPLAGTYFLGPPLPLGGRLYCLAETNSEIRLLAFDLTSKADGRNPPDLLWSQPLVGANVRIDRDAPRRTAGSTVSYADGVMVCPTDAGYVIGLDLTTRSLLWVYRYEQSVPFRFPRPFPRPNPRPAPPPSATDWQDSAAMIAEGRVVLTPHGTGELICLHLVDGAVAWKHKRGDGLYVAGLADGNVLVAGSGSVRAYRLADGKPGWKRPAPLPALSGRAAIAGNRLFVPAGRAGIVVLDTKTGRQLGRTALPDNRPPGNLIISGGTMLSQGVDAIDVFPLPLPGNAKAGKAP